MTDSILVFSAKILSLVCAFWIVSTEEETATEIAKFIAFFALLFFGVSHLGTEKPKTTAYQVCHDYDYWSTQPEDITTQYFVISDWFEDEATHSLGEYCFEIEDYLSEEH